jgi:hypothetical protein
MALPSAESMTAQERLENGITPSEMVHLRSMAPGMRDALVENGIDPGSADDWLTVLCLEIGCGWHASLHCRPEFVLEMIDASRKGATLLHVAAASVVAWGPWDVSHLDRSHRYWPRG